MIRRCDWVTVFLGRIKKRVLYKCSKSKYPQWMGFSKINLRLRSVVFCLLIICAMSVGCESWRWKLIAPDSKKKKHTTQGAWEIKPTSVRITSSTEFTSTKKDGDILELHIQLRDELQDPIKGSGTFTFRLTCPKQPSKDHQWPDSESPAACKATSILTLSQNRAHYKSVESAYRFNLGLKLRPNIGDTFTITAIFTSHDGTRITTKRQITHE